MYEFLLSLFIIGGAGYLLMMGVAPELCAGVITLVTGFWFSKRSNENAVNNLLRQSPTMVPIKNTIESEVKNDGGVTVGQ